MAAAASPAKKTRAVCAVCDVSVGKGKLMCLAHWQLVPVRLAMQINRSLRAYRSTPERAQRVLHLREYLQARQAAIAAVLMTATPAATFPEAPASPETLT